MAPRTRRIKAAVAAVAAALSITAVAHGAPSDASPQQGRPVACCHGVFGWIFGE